MSAAIEFRLLCSCDGLETDCTRCLLFGLAHPRKKLLVKVHWAPQSRSLLLFGQTHLWAFFWASWTRVAWGLRQFTVVNLLSLSLLCRILLIRGCDSWVKNSSSIWPCLHIWSCLFFHLSTCPSSYPLWTMRPLTFSSHCLGACSHCKFRHSIADFLGLSLFLFVRISLLWFLPFFFMIFIVSSCASSPHFSNLIQLTYSI